MDYRKGELICKPPHQRAMPITARLVVGKCSELSWRSAFRPKIGELPIPLESQQMEDLQIAFFLMSNGQERTAIAKGRCKCAYSRATPSWPLQSTGRSIRTCNVLHAIFKFTLLITREFLTTLRLMTSWLRFVLAVAASFRQGSFRLKSFAAKLGIGGPSIGQGYYHKKRTPYSNRN